MDVQPIHREPQAQPAADSPGPADARTVRVGQADPSTLRQRLLDALDSGNPVTTSMRKVDVQFEVDESINRVLARIVDSETGEVVREVPPEELVDLARRVAALLGVQLDRQA